MRNLFNLDNPFVQFLARVGDLIIVNVLKIFCHQKSHHKSFTASIDIGIFFIKYKVCYIVKYDFCPFGVFVKCIFDIFQKFIKFLRSATTSSVFSLKAKSHLPLEGKAC